MIKTSYKRLSGTEVTHQENTVKGSARKLNIKPSVENQDKGNKERARQEHAEISELLLNTQKQRGEGSTAK